jgi:hypothetical protein
MLIQEFTLIFCRATVILYIICTRGALGVARVPQLIIRLQGELEVPLHYPSTAKRSTFAVQHTSQVVGINDNTIITLRDEANFVTVSTTGTGLVEFLDAAGSVLGATVNSSTAQMYPIMTAANRVRLNNTGASTVYVTQLAVFSSP